MLADKQAAWKQQMEVAKKNAEKASERIVLNIGGTLFHTTKTTLLDETDTFFYAMLHSGLFEPDSQGICSFTLKGLCTQSVACHHRALLCGPTLTS